jgi:hypothetical protein
METEEVTQQIRDLYLHNVNIEEAIELMRDRNISAELVKAIYNQYSIDTEKLKTDRFYYYTINIENYLFMNSYYIWTSRYFH